MKKWKLNRTKQCSKCPWRKSTNPFDIPDGYCHVKHADLKKTIAEGTNIGPTLSVMACHHSTHDNMQHCIGWLVNQMGPGNNIQLRINMMLCENAREIKTYGEQHEVFEYTFPE